MEQPRREENQSELAVKVERPTLEVLYGPSQKEACQMIENIGRTCYQSYDRMTEDSAERFVRMIIKRGHLSLLENVLLTVRIRCSRGVADELMRHRHAVYACQSTRFCDMAKDGLTVCYADDPALEPYVIDSYRQAAQTYERMKAAGVPNDLARNILPLGMMTELNATANLREWRYIIALRSEAKVCHPEMVYIMNELLQQFKELYPIFFEDL